MKLAGTASAINAALFTLTSTYSFPKPIIQNDTDAQTSRNLKQPFNMIKYVHKGGQTKSELPIQRNPTVRSTTTALPPVLSPSSALPPPSSQLPQ